MIASILAAVLLAMTPANAVMQWTMHASSGGAVYFETRYSATTSSGQHSDQDGRDYGTSEFRSTFSGLTRAQLDGPSTSVHFTITRQEGTLTCVGQAHGGTASGDFTFALDPKFTSEMQRRGVGTVSPERQMEWLFASADVYGMLDFFASQRFPTPNVELLSKAIDHGVTVKYARDLAAAGMPALSVEQLVRAVDHGVRPAYVTALAAYGFRVGLDQAIAMVDHGVTASYLSGLSKYGYHVTPDQAILMSDHGVTLRYIAKLRDDGYANLSVADLVRLSDHGVH